MIKLRIEGLPNEVEAMIENLKNYYNVIEVSKPYPNRGESKLVRVYVTVLQN